MTGRNTGEGAQFVRGGCRSPSLAAHENVQRHGRRVQQRRAATGRTRRTSLTRLILNSRKHHTWAMPVCSLGAAATNFCWVLFLLPASSCASCCMPRPLNPDATGPRTAELRSCSVTCMRFACCLRHQADCFICTCTFNRLRGALQMTRRGVLRMTLQNAQVPHTATFYGSLENNPTPKKKKKKNRTRIENSTIVQGAKMHRMPGRAASGGA